MVVNLLAKSIAFQAQMLMYLASQLLLALFLGLVQNVTSVSSCPTDIHISMADGGRESSPTLGCRKQAKFGNNRVTARRFYMLDVSSLLSLSGTGSAPSYMNGKAYQLTPHSEHCIVHIHHMSVSII